MKPSINNGPLCKAIGINTRLNWPILSGHVELPMEVNKIQYKNAIHRRKACQASSPESTLDLFCYPPPI